MTQYAAFLLKVWHEPGQTGERIVLKNIHTGEKLVLNSAETLLEHIRTTTKPTPPSKARVIR